MLPSETLARVRRLHVRTRRLVDGLLAGEYHSVFKGRGMEFAEVRDYVPGDDVRTIDWNVTARLGRPFVKQYVEERELTVMLLVDVSASGRFGSVARLKSEVAAEVCALLALAALGNHDRVGMILFSDRIERHVPPQKGRRRGLRVIAEALAAQPEGRATDMALALETFRRTTRQRAVAFLISDFEDTRFERELRHAARRHDIVPICVSDRREDELPALGLLHLRDLESGETVLVDSGSRRVRAAYRQRRTQAAEARRRLFRTLGLDFVEVDTAHPCIDPLARFFRRRERRLN
jgi:uncharacterized protein (DUF58 family)